MFRLQKVSIIINVNKDKDLFVTKQLAAILQKLNFDYKLQKDIAENIGCEDNGCDYPELYKNVDAVIVLGGDGTILRCVTSCIEKNVPILGINLGRLGFLSSVEVEDLETCLKNIRDNNYSIQERMMLKCTVKKGDEELYTSYALNDVVIVREQFYGVIKLKVAVNNQLLDVLRGDGIVISTPTGSTAYSLSAGGPIVDPETDVMIATPICAHTLQSRSFIINPKDKVIINLDKKTMPNPAVIILDGKHGIDLDINSTVTIEKSTYTAKIIKVNDDNFYKILRNKLYLRGGE